MERDLAKRDPKDDSKDPHWGTNQLSCDGENSGPQKWRNPGWIHYGNLLSSDSVL